MTDRAEADDPQNEAVDPAEPFAGAGHDSLALRRARRRATAIGTALLIVAAVLTAGVLIDPRRPWFQGFDDRIWSWASTHQNASVVRLAELLDVIGSSPWTATLRAVAVLILIVRRRWTQLGIFLGAVVLSEICIGPLKALVGRPRPPAPLVETSGASFPSGHAIAAAVTAFGLVIAFLPRGRRRLRWGGVAAAVAGSMAFSRVYLRAHWATDTIAGVCLGVGFAVLVEALVESARRTVADHASSAADGDPVTAADRPRSTASDAAVDRRDEVESGSDRSPP